jgi:hypothetical protein
VQKICLKSGQLPATVKSDWTVLCHLEVLVIHLIGIRLEQEALMVVQNRAPEKNVARLAIW